MVILRRITWEGGKGYSLWTTGCDVGSGTITFYELKDFPPVVPWLSAVPCCVCSTCSSRRCFFIVGLIMKIFGWCSIS